MKRVRLNIKTGIKATYDTRPKQYMDLRYWWLHECAQWRAKRRVNGLNVKRELKAAQKELARLRKEYCT